jgi:hypothetical protein
MGGCSSAPLEWPWRSHESQQHRKHCWQERQLWLSLPLLLASTRLAAEVPKQPEQQEPPESPLPAVLMAGLGPWARSESFHFAEPGLQISGRLRVQSELASVLVPPGCSGSGSLIDDLVRGRQEQQQDQERQERQERQGHPGDHQAPAGNHTGSTDLDPWVGIPVREETSQEAHMACHRMDQEQGLLHGPSLACGEGSNHQNLAHQVAGLAGLPHLGVLDGRRDLGDLAVRKDAADPVD